MGSDPEMNEAASANSHDNDKPFHREAWFSVSIGLVCIIVLVTVVVLCVHASRREPGECLAQRLHLCEHTCTNCYNKMDS